jgi:hypothetical protein
MFLAGIAWGQEKPAKFSGLPSRKPVEIAATDVGLPKLLKERYNTAVAELEVMQGKHEAGQAALSDVAPAVTRVVESGLELQATSKDRAALLAQYVEFLRDMEQHLRTLVENGIVSTNEVHRARYERLTAEIRLLREQEKK